MDPTRFEKPPRWWGPLMRPMVVKLLRPVRRRLAMKVPRILEMEVRGEQHVREAIEAGHGVLITPNHSVHGDPLVAYEAAARVPTPLYFMGAWQVFAFANAIERLFLRLHGGFSVDREGTDIKAFRQAIEVLQKEPFPLVIFPEGEVYHLNSRVTPFREGPRAIALAAARRADRPIVIIPCGLRYYYLEDPMPALLEVMDRVEDAMFWRPRPDLSLPDRVYRVAEGMLGLKELEHLGAAGQGTIPARIARLADSVLKRVEEKYEIDADGKTVPERIKQGRQQAIQAFEELDEGSDEYKSCTIDLDDLFFAVQLFSYPGDYVSEEATIDRLAETIDKFEEDILNARSPTVRAGRKVTAVFGEPIEVSTERKKDAGHELTMLVEQSVQALLDSVPPPDRDFPTS